MLRLWVEMTKYGIRLFHVVSCSENAVRNTPVKIGSLSLFSYSDSEVIIEPHVIFQMAAV